LTGFQPSQYVAGAAAAIHFGAFLPRSAIDVIGLAFEHARKQLFEPFRSGQWTRLALLALATGEMSSGGGCNSGVKALSSLPSRLPNSTQNFTAPSDVWSGLGLDPAVIVSMVVVAVVGLFVLGLVWLYVSSVSRFLLFESVLRRDCELSESWGRWQKQGLRYFGFQLALSIVGLGVAAILFVPLLLPVVAALLKGHQAPGAGLFIALLPMILVFTAFGLLMALIGVLTKDFLIPLMAVDGVGVIEGWRRLLAMMTSEKASYAGYVGMKIVLAIGASVVFGIVSAIIAAIALIPVAILVVLVVLLVRGGLNWNAATITLAIVVGTILLAGLLYVIALVCVPVAVFFPAYAMYFFAERYPALQAQLYPQPPAAPPPSFGSPPLPEPS
jgi:hypothetical protein